MEVYWRVDTKFKFSVTGFKMRVNDRAIVFNHKIYPARTLLFEGYERSYPYTSQGEGPSLIILKVHGIEAGRSMIAYYWGRHRAYDPPASSEVSDLLDGLCSGKPGYGMPWKAGPLAPSDKKEEQERLEQRREEQQRKKQQREEQERLAQRRRNEYREIKRRREKQQKEEYKKNPAFRCKHCGEMLEWRPEWGGKRGQCYKCNGYFTFPNKPD